MFFIADEKTQYEVKPILKDGSTEGGHVCTQCSYLCFVYKIAVWNF